MKGAEYAELLAFVAVARERNFRRAAARLGLSPSAVSHTLRAVEERLGVRLLNRTTRSVALTEAGLALLDRVAPALSDIDAALEGLSAERGRPTGTVRLNLPKLAARCLMPAFVDFSQRHPQVRLEISADDNLTDVVAAGFDAGIRLGEYLHRDMAAVRVTPTLPSVIVGSPAYFAAHPKPRSPEDLQHHLCVHYRFAATGALFKWALARRGRTVEVDTRGTLSVDDADLVVDAALRGAGLAFTLKDHAADLLAQGRLVAVLEGWCRPFDGFFLYHPGRRQQRPALRALIDHLRVSEPAAA